MRGVVLLSLGLLALPGSSAAADQKTLAERAIALCRVRHASEAEREKAMHEGLALAEQALDANEDDAEAHYAVFCLIGRKLEQMRPTPAVLFDLRRVRTAIDRAIELRPDWAEALMGKGSLLVHTPWIMGGSVSEGVRFLRRAIAADPEHVEAHIQLAEALDRQGKRDEARSVARHALELAEKNGDEEGVAEAHETLTALGDPTDTPEPPPGAADEASPTERR